MAQNEPITTKFKVDISDLKKGISEANQSIKLANAQFKAASAGMEDWQKTTQGVEAKLSQLNSVLGAQKSKLANYQKQLQQLEQAQQENGKRAEELKAKYQEEVRQFGENSKKAQELKTALNGVEKEQLANEKAADRMRVTMLNQQAAVSRTEREIKDYESSLKKIKSGLKGLDDAIGLVAGAFVGVLAEGIKTVLNSLKDFTLEGDEAMSKFQASTGVSEKAMGKFKKEILSLYKSGAGESITDVAEAMAEVKRQLNETDPSKLKELTDKAISLRDTFGFDISESVRTVNQMMTQFGINSAEAFNLLVQGARAGLDKNGNLLDVINEYGPKFKQMGLSATDMFNMLKRGADAGVFDIDKLGDAMNDFSINVKDGTANDAFKALGLDVEETTKAFGKGGKSAKDAFTKVMTGLSEVKDPIKQNNLGVQLFGSMWEDTGGKAILAMKDTEGAIDKTKNSMEDLQNKRFDNIRNEFTKIGRSIQIDVLYPIAQKLLPGIKNFVDYCTKNLDTLIPVITGVGTAFGAIFIINKIATFVRNLQRLVGIIKGWELATKAQAVAQGILNAVLNANPLVLIITAIAAVVAAIVTLIATNEKFRNKVLEVFNAAKAVIGGFVNTVVQFFTATLPNGFKNAVNAVVNFGKNVISGIATLPAKFLKLVTSIIKGVTKWGTQLVSKGGSVAKGFLKAVIKAITFLPTQYYNIITKVLPKVVSWGAKLVSKGVTAAKNFLSRVVSGVKSLPSKIYGAISGAISRVATWGSNLVSKGKAAAKNFATAVINGIKSIPGKVTSIGKNIVQGIWSGISGAADWLAGKVKSFASGIVKNIKDKLKIKSPSRVMRDEVGKYLVAGIEEGITGGEKSLVNTMKGTMDNVVKAGQKEGAPFKLARQSGEFFTQGFTNGIVNLANGAVQAAKVVGSKALESLNTELDEHSASKKTKKSGKYFTQGFVKGILSTKEQKALKKAPSTVAKSVLSGLTKSMTGAEISLASLMKSVIGNVAATAKQVANGKFTDAGNAAAESFSNAIQEKLKFCQDKVSYQYEQELNKFDSKITKLEKDKKNDVDAAKKKRDKALKKLKNSKKYKNASKKSKKKMVESLNNKYAPGIKDIEKYYNDAIKAVKSKQDAYQKATEKSLSEFNDAMSKFGSEAEKMVSDTINGITETYQARWDNLTNLQNTMVSKLQGFGELFTVSGAGVMSVNDIKQQTEDIKAYMDRLNTIKGKVSEDLFNQISTYDVDQGKAFMDQLLSMSDAELKAYNDAYTEKMNVSEQMSKNLYQSDFDKVSKEYGAAINNAFKGLGSQLEALGKQCMSGFVDGLKSDTSYLSKAVKDVANSIISSFKSSLKIHSPSKVFAELGGFSAEGYGEGFKEQMDSLRRSLAASVPMDAIAKASGRISYGGNKTTNQNVNQVFNQYNTSPKALSRLEIYRQTKNALSFSKGV